MSRTGGGTGQHDLAGTGRGEYERHMCDHGLKAPKSSYQRWKPPRAREYAPKPMDPGQRIEWRDGQTGQARADTRCRQMTGRSSL
ncbi:MAG: hypothetical protein J2P25_22675 [Nocardiopsaceae bacterium]|nr:hypothetical protein [Nocardiopsaceae bacterium]